MLPVSPVLRRRLVSLPRARLVSQPAPDLALAPALLAERQEAMAPVDRRVEFRCARPVRRADRFAPERSAFQSFPALARPA